MEQKIYISIEDVKLVSFAKTDLFDQITEFGNKENYQFTFEFKGEPIVDDKIYIASYTITPQLKTPDGSKDIAILKTSCVFSVTNWDEVVTKDNNQLNIPYSLIYNAAGIALSTTRGILAMLVKDTALSKLILPIINVQEQVLSHLNSIGVQIK
ncbi:MAG: hypothetical protein M0D57_08880 [Sphingobacteriales bacterium JAD_PAG50586_3]|nr:MAG: hypothetical protein M0D57_08880 [Sphingobacteriales bacterium JAD_PAG50586_3]